MQAPVIPLTQTKAVTACEDLWPGGYLASIESECENDFVVELLGQTSGWEQTYLGATDLDTEGSWTWIKTGGSTFWEGGDPTAGGAAVSGMYANFFDGEPNNAGTNGQDCLVIGESDGEWRDQLCSKTSQFLCETAATEGGASITPPQTTLGSTIVCSSTCDDGWEQTDECLCYQVQNDLRTWLEARTACSTLKTGATLVSLTSEAIELKILEMFGGFSSALDDASANDGGGANGYWTGGNDLTNLASNDIITSDDTEFKWDFDQDVFWRRDTNEAAYCCEVDGKYNNWIHISDVNIMPNHNNEKQNCVKMKFVADDSGNLEKAGWDDIDCEKKPIKSVCQYSVL